MLFDTGRSGGEIVAAKDLTATARSGRKSAETAARLDRGELDMLLGFRLRMAWSYMEHYFSKCFQGTGITPQHYAMLLVIEKNSGCRISDLCRAIKVSPTNIVPALDLLMQRGLVFRDFSTHDRRAKRLGLTELGASYLAELKRLHQPITAHFEERLGAANMRLLVRLLAQATGEG